MLAYLNLNQVIGFHRLETVTAFLFLFSIPVRSVMPRRNRNQCKYKGANDKHPDVF
jgi:hypothetical protein